MLPFLTVFIYYYTISIFVFANTTVYTQDIRDLIERHVEGPAILAECNRDHVIRRHKDLFVRICVSRLIDATGSL